MELTWFHPKFARCWTQLQIMDLFGGDLLSWDKIESLSENGSMINLPESCLSWEYIQRLQIESVSVLANGKVEDAHCILIVLMNRPKLYGSVYTTA